MLTATTEGSDKGPTVARTPVPIVVSQHVADAAVLHTVRAHLVSAPHARLRHVGRLDERMAAHLDGVAVAGEFGAQLALAALESPGVGELFVATVGAIGSGQSISLDKLFSLMETLPEANAGLISAFGWVSAHTLRGTVSELLGHAEPLRKCVGIAACSMHRVDPGATLDAAIVSSDARLRARALRCAGETGRRDLLPVCLQQVNDEDQACAFWAAWSAALLGDRGAAVISMSKLCPSPNPNRERALQLVLKILSGEDTHVLLKTLAQNPANLRALIQGTGIAGDPFYVPWLIKQMADEKMTRLAGESFSFITGLDLAYLGLDKNSPENTESGPNDDPNDDNVAMDEDDNLPSPDPVKIQVWWDSNKSRFTEGVRYFMGAPVTREHCVHALKEGYQRQRIAAAQYLCLLQPGTQLFPTSAPAWRQQRWLAKMG